MNKLKKYWKWVALGAVVLLCLSLGKCSCSCNEPVQEVIEQIEELEVLLAGPNREMPIVNLDVEEEEEEEIAERLPVIPDRPENPEAPDTPDVPDVPVNPPVTPVEPPVQPPVNPDPPVNPPVVPEPEPVKPKSYTALEWLINQYLTSGTTIYNYFATRTVGVSLDSTGFNWAPIVNDELILAVPDVVDSNGFAWRIIKGDSENGTDVIFSEESVDDKEVGDILNDVVATNTIDQDIVEGTAEVGEKTVDAPSGGKTDIEIIIDFVEDIPQTGELTPVTEPVAEPVSDPTLV